MTVIPLADVADRWLRDLARESGCTGLDDVTGAALLGERAAARGLRIPGRVSAGGGCRLYDTRNGVIALNLARPDDRAALPALFGTDGDFDDAGAVAAACRNRDTAALLAQGRSLGLAIAAMDERPGPALVWQWSGSARRGPCRPPRVVDLSSLWAGPLATHLLLRAGATVTRIDSLSRPDPMRDGDPLLFDRLDRGKATRALDLTTSAGRDALHALIAASDIVVSAGRPRALAQLGIDADAAVRAQPGLTWIAITAHGEAGDAGGHVGFGDDCGVAGGLGAALYAATGRIGFVGDAIADPLTGVFVARAAWRAHAAGGGCRIAVSMAGIVGAAMADAAEAGTLVPALHGWAAAEGAAFPAAARC